MHVNDFVYRPPSQLIPPSEHKQEAFDETEPRFNLGKYLQQIIARLTDAALEAGKQIQAAINSVFTEITVAITEIQNDALQALTDIFNEMNEKLIDWQHIGACFNNQANTLRNISLEARNNINQCQKNGTEALQAVHDAFADQREAIVNEFNAIYDVLETCSTDKNPLQIVLCVRAEVRTSCHELFFGNN